MLRPVVFVEGLQCVAAADLSRAVMEAYWDLVPYRIPRIARRDRAASLESTRDDYWRAPRSFAYVLLASEGRIRMLELANLNGPSEDPYRPQWLETAHCDRGHWQHHGSCGAEYVGEALAPYGQRQRARKAILFALPSKLPASSAWLVWPVQAGGLLNFSAASAAPLQTSLFARLNKQAPRGEDGDARAPI